MSSLYTLVVITATAFSSPQAIQTPNLEYGTCQMMAQQQNLTKMEYHRTTALCVTPDQADKAAAIGVQMMSAPISVPGWKPMTSN